MIWGAHVTEDGKSIKRGTNHLGNIYMSFYNKLSSKPLLKTTTKEAKNCPEGKVRNEKTGRCITVKTVKPCPEGKVRNEKTGRCITLKNKP
jgi:hypothetical protein